jgi:DNA polymerase
LPGKLREPFLIGCKKEECDLYGSTYPVRPRGSWNSKVLGIGEAAGEQETKNNCTFVGPAGALLDDTMNEIGLSLDKNFLLTNVCLCQPLPPPNTNKQNRTPSKQEIASCRTYLEKVVKLYNPKLLLLIGGKATSSVLKNNPRIGEVIGRFLGHERHSLDVQVNVYSIWHPAYIIRNLEQKSVWKKHLIKLRDYMIGANLIAGE